MSNKLSKNLSSKDLWSKNLWSKNLWTVVFRQDRCIGCGTCVAACKAWNHEKRADADIVSLYARMDSIEPQFAEPDDDRGTMREDWIRLTTEESGDNIYNYQRKHMVISCMHCDEPACAAACPNGRIVKDAATGIVSVMPDGEASSKAGSASIKAGTASIKESAKCISCGLCRKACPVGAPQLVAKLTMTKCDLCADRLEQGLKPACAAACPVRAIKIFSAEDMAELYPEGYPGAVNICELPGYEQLGVLKPNYQVVPRI